MDSLQEFRLLHFPVITNLSGLPSFAFRIKQATHAVISLTGDERQVVASVTDDGKGMPDATRLGPREDGGGFGTGGKSGSSSRSIEFICAPWKRCRDSWVGRD